MDQPPCCMSGELTSPADVRAAAALRENSSTIREETLEPTRDRRMTRHQNCRAVLHFLLRGLPLGDNLCWLVPFSRWLRAQNQKITTKKPTSNHWSNRSKNVCSPLNTCMFEWSGKFSSNCTALIFHMHPQDLWNKIKSQPSPKNVCKISRETVSAEENFIAIKKKPHLENNCLLHSK